MGVFGEGLCTGHHEGGPFLQLPQPLASLIQSNAGPRQIPHHAAGCHFHALHPPLPGDVLGQTPRSLASCRLTNCRQHQVKRSEKMSGGVEIKHILG